MRTDLPEPDAHLDDLAHQVIGAAIAVHKTLGPGFLEAVYEAALCIELTNRGVPFARQAPLAIRYRDEPIGQCQPDLLVGGRLIVELKSVEALSPLHTAQVRSYLKATGCTLALLINFNVTRLAEGIKRIILSS
jgi:GxxExxY protein